MMVSFANDFLFFFSSFLSLVGFLGSPVPWPNEQPDDQLCNDFVVMCYEIQIQIAGLI